MLSTAISSFVCQDLAHVHVAMPYVGGTGHGIDIIVICNELDVGMAFWDEIMKLIFSYQFAKFIAREKRAPYATLLSLCLPFPNILSAITLDVFFW